MLLLAAALPARACPKGNPDSLAYIRRDNNRCEGVQPRNATDTFSLISFSTGTPSDYGDRLTIRVPGTRVRPELEVQSFSRNYRLDRVASRFNGSGSFLFALNTRVLQRAEISPGSLRATAYINEGARIYLPVVLGSPSERYEFVVNNPRQRAFPTFEIRGSDGRVVKASPRKVAQRRQVYFTWVYGKAPAGEYQLHIKDDRGQKRVFWFRHNRRWF